MLKIPPELLASLQSRFERRVIDSDDQLKAALAEELGRNWQRYFHEAHALLWDVKASRNRNT